MVNKKLFPFIVVLLVVLFISIVLYIFFPRKCRRVSCVIIDGSQSWHLSDIYEEKDEVYRAQYTLDTPDLLVRVDIRKVLDNKTATDYIRARIAGMKALYDNIRSPYPGLLSNEIKCDEGYKPTYKTYVSSGNVEINQITGFLNDRLTFGTCTNDQIAYKAIKLLFLCPKRAQIYDIEFIAPLAGFPEEKFESIASSLQCR